MAGVTTGPDPLSLQFINPAFGPIDKYNVLQYFAATPFFDANCKNFEIATRYQLEVLPFPSSDKSYYSIKENALVDEKLKEIFNEMDTEKCQFDVAQCEGTTDCFVISQLRYISDAKDSLSTEALFFVQKGYIYQIPDMASIGDSRMLNMVCFLQKALREGAEFKRFNTKNGYSWEFEKKKETLELEQKWQKKTFIQSTETQIYLEQVNEAVRTLNSRVQEKIQKLDEKKDAEKILLLAKQQDENALQNTTTTS